MNAPEEEQEELAEITARLTPEATIATMQESFERCPHCMGRGKVYDSVLKSRRLRIEWFRFVRERIYSMELVKCVRCGGTGKRGGIYAMPIQQICNCGSWPDPFWTEAMHKAKYEAMKQCPVHRTSTD